MLKTENISYQIGSKKILDNVSLHFLPGRFNIILGPNGSGKSTFLKIFGGELAGYDGTVMYADKKLATLSKEKLACCRAVMSQQPDLHFPLTVEEVVMMGRYPHFDFNPGKKDFTICNDALTRMNLQPLKERNYLTLSGGEKQRVHFARVLTQIWEKPANGSSRYLFLDEPLNNLDISYQQEFMQLARSFVNEGVVLVAVLHDINLAAQFGDQLFFFKEGQLMAQGSPADTINVSLLEHIFSITPDVMKNPATGVPLIFFR